MNEYLVGQHLLAGDGYLHQPLKTIGLRAYADIKADVRYTGKHESIKALVQPDDPVVRDIARVLVADKDFVSACQAFVNSFTTYGHEIGDYWRLPGETLFQRRSIDCDDSAILLCSLLRNYLPADKVYCAFGTWDRDGHMWVVREGPEHDRLVESTASPSAPLSGNYHVEAIFNDKYALATDEALKEFDLLPVPLGKEAVRS